MKKEQTLKRCSGCRVEKPLDEFSKKGIGLNPRCRVCDAAKCAEWYSANKAKHLLSVKRWADANKDKTTASKKKWKEANKEQIAAYDEKNKERRRIKLREYRNANREQINARVRRWCGARREELNQRSSAWYAAHPEKSRAQCARRRAERAQAMPSWADKKYIAIFYKIAKEESERTGQVCHVDHIVPLKSKLVCGLHNEFNLQVLFGSDNQRKRNSWWPDMPERESCR